MPRFFFNYRERNEFAVDDSGIEFESFEAAWLDAFNTAREMWPEIMARRVDPRTCAFEIMDSNGNLLAIVNFKELLENCSQYPQVASGGIDGTFATMLDTAYRTRRGLAEFREELHKTRGRLSAVRQLVDSIDDGNRARRGA